jgi:DNA polymerase III subunit delta'
VTENPLTTLGTRLCPWLVEPLGRLEAARRAQRLGCAWLVKGAPGIGKSNLVHVFARRLLDGVVEEPAALSAVQAAEAMRGRFAPADHHPDLHPVFPEPEKRTIGIDQIRGLSAALSMKGYRGGAKVAIIEPAEAMTLAAANALLKTLEEPADETFLFLISHQPERLLPTIRSRCQSLAVAPPSGAAASDWLGLAADHPVLRMAGRAPLLAAELLDQNKATIISELEDKLHDISKHRVDPKIVADEWARNDTELALRWLIGRLEGSIRRRMSDAQDSKGVTSGRADPLHNAWLALSVRVLFERHEAAQRLLDRLGSGINAELALHALLLGLRAERGKS